MSSLNSQGELSIDAVVIIVILLVLFIALVIYMGILQGSSGTLLDNILGVFTGQ